ncbi:MAG: HD domain-containing protein [Planctomycetaceae bacterium]|jgi:HD superfamily phosphohydrolase|nr:HD domain-containing protein [Planctomycetaceae bacterium]
MLNLYADENLSQDAVHGYIPFTAAVAERDIAAAGNIVAERDIIDSPWVQRLRQIHQLQTAWLVYPTAEHTRFQHSIGTMHLASRMLQQLYPSLKEVCASEGESLPSRCYLESLVRTAGLLHDIGHGPFGHFFDARFLSHYGLNHEKIGAYIIRNELAAMLKKIRRNPLGELNDDETLDAEHVAFLIVRPQKEQDAYPLYLKLLRSLFCGLYTADNMDFVLRDALMTGFSPKVFDLDRLLHYSFFTKYGLTVHQKGFATLIRFLAARAELFRSVYFHRTVRAIDLDLNELFIQSRDLLFTGNPLERLDEYRHFTEWSLLVDVSRWNQSADERKRTLYPLWNNFLNRKVTFHSAAETTAVFSTPHSEQTSIFADDETFRRAVIQHLPDGLKTIPFAVDIARHLHRPDSNKQTGAQNFLYEPATDKVRRLEEEELYRHLPQSYRICRIYTQDKEHTRILAKALERLVNGTAEDDETNM